MFVCLGDVALFPHTHTFDEMKMCLFKFVCVCLGMLYFLMCVFEVRLSDELLLCYLLPQVVSCHAFVCQLLLLHCYTVFRCSCVVMCVHCL